MSLHTINKEYAEKLKKRAAAASISLASFLTCLKLFASVYSGSLAVLSSMIDSLSDLFASAITYVAVRYSAKDPTDEHRYGYGKVEALSALFQAAFIAGSGLFVMYDGVQRLLEPRIITQTPTAIGIMLFSLVSTFVLIAYQRHVAVRTGSTAIKADSAHYTVDILTNASIIVSLLLVKFFNIDWFDTLTAFAIAAYLLFNAYQLAAEAIAMLLDRELDDDIRENIQKIIMAHKFAYGLHDLRTRSLGNMYLFEIHLELDGSLTLYDAHDLTETIEKALLKEYPNAQIIIHQDPVGIKEERLDTQLKKSKRKTKK